MLRLQQDKVGDEEPQLDVFMLLGMVCGILGFVVKVCACVTSHL